MSNTEKVIRNAIAGVIALGVVAGAGQAMAAAGDNEKCSGIVKAGKNDCGTSKSSCAGTVKVDRDAEAWVFVPKGTCDKIAGGVINTSPHAKPGGAAGK